MKTISLSDLPLDQSLNDFGTEGYVKGLERFISHAASPITIALQGEWGSGKTSLMNRLYLDLCSDGKDFIGININTWEYSMLATPEETILKIIGELINSLTEKESNINSKARQIFHGIVNVAYRFGREFAKGIVPLAGPTIEAIGVPAEMTSSDADKPVASISKLKEILTKSIQDTLDSTGKKGILIFVDDLDRLNPPLAVQILELLKNIFTIDKCIFILAIDYDVVVKGLEPKFGKFSEVNEREFRSFFDKIIQVPFSLPVNNYKPMNFVLDSLEAIGYITSGEKSRKYVQNTFALVVDSSVGKNPRSIKRLINTLSLLDCIGKCTSLEEIEDSIEAKITSFAIVALQVCYPKVYDIMRFNPVFNNWNANTASKFNLNFDKEQPEDIDGNAILDAVCLKDVFMNTHKNEIHSLLDLIHKTASAINEDNPAEVITKILDRSSVTNVSVSVETEKFDAKEFQITLRDNVWRYIESKAPNVKWHRWKRNNGSSGGIVFRLSDESTFDVVFEPKTKLVDAKSSESGQILTLKVWLDIMHSRPGRMRDKNYNDVISDSEVLTMLTPLNDAVTRYVGNETIESTTYGGQKFNSLIDELSYRGKDDGLRDYITPNTQYWINHKSASNFEEKTTIAAIGDLIIGAYELNERAIALK